MFVSASVCKCSCVRESLCAFVSVCFCECVCAGLNVCLIVCFLCTFLMRGCVCGCVELVTGTNVPAAYACTGRPADSLRRSFANSTRYRFKP